MAALDNALAPKAMTKQTGGREQTRIPPRPSVHIPVVKNRRQRPAVHGGRPPARVAGLLCGEMGPQRTRRAAAREGTEENKALCVPLPALSCRNPAAQTASCVACVYANTSAETGKFIGAEKRGTAN